MFQPYQEHIHDRICWDLFTERIVFTLVALKVIFIYSWQENWQTLVGYTIRMLIDEHSWPIRFSTFRHTHTKITHHDMICSVLWHEYMLCNRLSTRRMPGLGVSSREETHTRKTNLWLRKYLKLNISTDSHPSLVLRRRSHLIWHHRQNLKTQLSLRVFNSYTHIFLP